MVRIAARNSKRQIGQRLLRQLQRARRLAMNGDRHIDLGHGAVDRPRRLIFGHALRQVEGEGGGDKGALVIDRKRRGAGAIADKGR